MLILENIGHELRRIRESKGLKLIEVAEKAGMSKGSLSFIENGINSPTFDTFKKILIALDVSPEEFFSVEKDILALPEDIQDFVNKEGNQDLIRCISKMKERGYTSKGITEMLASLQKIVDDAIEGKDQVTFVDIQEDTDKLLKDFKNKRHKKTK